MKICPRCQKTYTDDGLNFCLDDGTTLSQMNAGGSSSEQATVFMNQPRPTNQNQPFGGQTGAPNGWNAPPPSSMPPPKKSREWLWVLGILGGLVLICGGGFTAFIFWAANLENDNRNTANASNYNYNSASRSPSPPLKNAAQTIDLSKWIQKDESKGLTEYRDGELLMNSKSRNFYFVLLASEIYKTENAVTKVTVKNVNEEKTNLGFGLIIHSNPVPLLKDYAFLIDSENKKYRVVRHSPGEETLVSSWTRAAAIKDGTQANVLEVRDQNKKMNFYINGEFIKAFDNTEGYSGGVAGIYAGDAVKVAFSNLEIAK